MINEQYLNISGLFLGGTILIQEQPISFLLGVATGFCVLCIPYLKEVVWKKNKKK